MNANKEEKLLREALIRRRAAEIMELALSETPSTASAARRPSSGLPARVAEKYGRPEGMKKGGKR